MGAGTFYSLIRKRGFRSSDRRSHGYAASSPSHADEFLPARVRQTTSHWESRSVCWYSLLKITMPDKPIPNPFRSPLAYENPKFTNGPDGRPLRILSEYS